VEQRTIHATVRYNHSKGIFAAFHSCLRHSPLAYRTEMRPLMDYLGVASPFDHDDTQVIARPRCEPASKGKKRKREGEDTRPDEPEDEPRGAPTELSVTVPLVQSSRLKRVGIKTAATPSTPASVSTSASARSSPSTPITCYSTRDEFVRAYGLTLPKLVCALDMFGRAPVHHGECPCDRTDSFEGDESRTRTRRK
jgi:hypothetical protein